MSQRITRNIVQIVEFAVHSNAKGQTMSNAPAAPKNADLAEILKYLNPPQQDYAALNTEIKNVDVFETPLERAIAAFYRMFAGGYKYWQDQYDYPRIHEYFYGGFLAAEDIVARTISRSERILAADLLSFFTNHVRTFIFNTGCENALICSSAKMLLDSAEGALRYCERTRKIWDSNSIVNELLSIEEKQGKDVRAESYKGIHARIKDYLDLNYDYFQGVVACAKLSLLPYKLPSEWQDAQIQQYRKAVDEAMVKVHPRSRELLSELRAYYAAANYAVEQYKKNGYTSLRVQQADILLRGVGYVGKQLIDPLFEVFEKERGDSDIKSSALEKTGLTIEQLSSGGFLNDAFETEAGTELLESLVMRLPLEENTLTIDAPDGSAVLTHSIDSLEVTISKFGTISVEFALSAGDSDEVRSKGVSASHTRLIESLLGPHVGALQIKWIGAPTSLEGEANFVQPEVENYVSYLLECLDWFQSGKDKGYFDQRRDEVAVMEGLLEDWKDSIRNFSSQLLLPSKDTFEKRYRQNRSDLQKNLMAVHREFLSWESWLNELPKTLANQAPDEVRKFIANGQKMFPNGRAYSKLGDVATEIMNRVEMLLRHYAGISENEDEEAYVDLDREFSFDPYSGWQSIIMVNRLAVRNEKGELPEFPTEEQRLAALNHYEFKAFKIPGREARAGIDDWLMALVPEDQKNLAHLRSHYTDAMYVGQNRVFMYFPDDPMFILTQYRDNSRFIGGVRVILLAHRVAAKRLAHKCAAALYDKEKPVSSEVISSLLGNIQKLRSQITSVFELMQDITLTRFQDHAELMVAMLDEIQAERFKEMLNESMTMLDMYENDLKWAMMSGNK
ncbi:MAG: hypothetical protein KF726_09090 [Anaerolineae bacterium]|nr:hypothetical protein [Anaerolineae bacterium]